MKIKELYSQFKKKITVAFPAILLFIFLFYTVIKLFGSQYALIVIFITITFQIRYNQKFNFKTAAEIFLIQSLLCFLSFAATLNIPLCIILNLLVPFILVAAKTNQLNQRGYFEHVMSFVYLQLRPVSFSEFPHLFFTLLYAVSIMVLFLALHSIFKKRSDKYLEEKNGLSILSKEFLLFADGKTDNDIQEGIFKVESSLYKLTFGSRDFSYSAKGNGRIHFMFALLFQRSSFFLYDIAEQKYIINDSYYNFFKNMSIYLDEASVKMNDKDNKYLIDKANNLLTSIDDSEERLHFFCENFIHLFILILENMTKNNISNMNWRRIKYAKSIDTIVYRIKSDSFQLRFAFRLSIVIMISFLFCRNFDVNHSYWLPMSAFLMLQPLYEDSNNKMKVRFFGTIAGSVIAFLVVPYLHGINAHFIFVTFLVGFTYYVKRGTWLQVMFTTTLSITIASLSMNDSTAIELRFIYLLLAAFLVITANRFFLPTNKKNQFYSNIKGLFRIQSIYISVLKDNNDSDNYGYLSEILSNFYMLYNEIIEYITKNKDDDFSFYKQLIFIMWKIMSESEQISFVIQKEEVSEEEKNMVRNFFGKMQIIFKNIARNIFSKNELKDNVTSNMENFEVKTEYLNYLIKGYKKNMTDLLSLLLSYKVVKNKTS